MAIASREPVVSTVNLGGGNIDALHAVILERNKLVARKIARLFLSVGMTAETIGDPALVAPACANADLVCADAFDGDLVAEQVRARRQLRGILWTAEPLRRSLRYLAESPAIDHVIGRRDFEAPPRAWEILMIGRRLVDELAVPSLGAYLDWGFSAEELEVRSPADCDHAVARIAQVVAALHAPKRIAEMFGELGYELIMNAIYDAPVDSLGRPRFASDRKVGIQLDDGERATVRLGSDGTHLVLQVRDPFGRLARNHVISGLARGLSGGELDRKNGGAGLGFTMCHHASSALVFDVSRGRQTEVTAILELDMNLREFRTQAKSLHWWSR
jgi:hypothetical protein